ncbi:hypothetical protein AAG906_008184 [Vitis piasezkii]
MDNSLQQDLIESYLPDNGSYYCLGDDGTDESHFIYILNAILSGTARLNVLLPTATILAFTIFAPSSQMTANATCSTLQNCKGRLYYGVATRNGIWTFNGGRRKPCVPSEYRLRWIDLFHALLSLIAFLTFAGSHNDVLECYHLEMSRKVTNSVPLVVGFVISVLFVVFPSKRRGIGYPFLLQKDALYTRN